MAISFKGAHFPQDIILIGVRWYVAYPLSYRHVEELMEERGVSIDHATIQRWVVKYSPQWSCPSGVRIMLSPEPRVIAHLSCQGFGLWLECAYGLVPRSQRSPVRELPS